MSAGRTRAHAQASYAVRLEQGPTGATAIAGGPPPADVAVVVDVLSFTTTLDVAVGRGIDVLPYRWRDEGAVAYAAGHDAVLAVGRLEAREGRGDVTLSPAVMAAVEGVERIVLPSPNGSSIAFGLAESGAQVLGACLRNATAVAAGLAPLVGAGGVVAFVAAGERWPDGSLRSAVEDLWGAGAVLSALRREAGTPGWSPEAVAAADAFESVATGLPDRLRSCASGLELVAAGFAEDVAVAAAYDVSTVVPVLVGDAFVAGRSCSLRPASAGGS